MAYSEAQKRATLKYRREKTKNITVTFYQKEADIYEWLQKQPNKQGYIKSLIRADMEREGEAQCRESFA